MKYLFDAVFKNGVTLAVAILLGLGAVYVIGVQRPGGIALLMLTVACVVVVVARVARLLWPAATPQDDASAETPKDDSKPS